MLSMSAGQKVCRWSTTENRTVIDINTCVLRCCDIVGGVRWSIDEGTEKCCGVCPQITQCYLTAKCTNHPTQNRWKISELLNLEEQGRKNLGGGGSFLVPAGTEDSTRLSLILAMPRQKNTPPAWEGEQGKAKKKEIRISPRPAELPRNVLFLTVKVL